MMVFRKLGTWFKMRGMSPPGGIDCSDVVAQLYEYIDEELDDRRAEQIREHLRLCKRCFPRYDFEKAFLRFLSVQGRSSVPPELRRRIFQDILEQESQS